MSNKILFFKDITIESLEEPEVEEEEFPEYVESQFIVSTPFSDDPNSDKEFTSNIPQYFIDMKMWPKSTNLRCWFCHEQFITIPYPIFLGEITLYKQGDIYKSSLDYGVHPGINEVRAFTTYGNFCELSCCNSYLDLIRDNRIINTLEAKNLLRTVHKIFLGKDATLIGRKPLWTIKKKYSGQSGITTDQFREY